MAPLHNGLALRAQIIGTGLIGGSIGLGLRARGWWVTGRDLDPDRSARALALGLPHPPPLKQIVEQYLEDFGPTKV